MNWIRGGFYIVLAACAILLTRDLHELMPGARTALESIQAIEMNTTRTEAEMSGLLNTARHIALDERQDANKQLATAAGLAARGSRLLDDADAAVRHLDASAVQFGTVGTAATDAIGRISVDTHETLGAGQETLRAATEDLSDPHLKRGFADFGASAASAAIATKEAAGAMTDVHRVTTYEAKQIMAPVTKIKMIALEATRFLGKFFGF